MKDKIAGITKKLREIINKDTELKKTVDNLLTIPGIGQVTATAFVTEVMDIYRFKRLDELCSYVGLVPSEFSSGERIRTGDISMRHSKYLRYMLIEASWVAIRRDSTLLMSYTHSIYRMSRQEAIIKITKKLLNRVMHVWKTGEAYKIAA